MQIQHVGYRIKGFYRAACLGHLWEMTSKHAQQRLNILGFFAEHGAAATCDAFDVSRRTLYRWKQALRQAGGDRAALTAKSCAPKRRRQPQAPPALVRQIRWLREKFPMAKAGLAAGAGSKTSAERLHQSSPAIQTKCAMPPLDWMRGRHKLIPRKRKTRKPKGFKHQPLRLVVRLRDGLRRYLFTFIDPHSRSPSPPPPSPASRPPSPLTRCVNCCQNRRASSSPITARSSWDASSNASMTTA